MNRECCDFICRKLKNRVAAQTARDRKKARMTELEESLALFEEEVCLIVLLEYLPYNIFAKIYSVILQYLR